MIKACIFAYVLVVGGIFPILATGQTENSWAEKRQNFAHAAKQSADASIKRAEPFDHQAIMNLFHSIVLAGEPLQSVDVEKPEDLLALAEAAKTLHFYVQSDQSAEILETQALRLIDALAKVDEDQDSRSIYLAASRRLIQDSYDAHVDTRQINKANHLSERFPEIRTLEWHWENEAIVTEPTTLHARQLPTGEIRVKRNQLNIGNGKIVVAAVSPLCGPSMRAISWLEENLAAEPILSEIQLIVSSRDTRVMLDSVLDWNRNSEFSELVLDSNSGEWPDGVWFDQTPIFYLIESGQLIDRLVGWPSDDQGARLTDQIQSFLEPSDK